MTETITKTNHREYDSALLLLQGRQFDAVKTKPYSLINK